MKNRLYSQIVDSSVPGVYKDGGSTNVNGKCIIQPEDQVGHAAYEVRPQLGEEVTFQSPEPLEENKCGMNHIYYCVSGSGDAVVETTGEKFSMDARSILALPPARKVKFVASSKLTRIFIIHCRGDKSDNNEPAPCFTKLSSLIETERNVSWGRGWSRRYLTQSDGFNISVHNTICFPFCSSPLQYNNNYESAYVLRGDMKYTWDEGKSESSFRQESASDGDGWLMLMDKHDSHVAHANSRESEAICVFYPPLKGTETHDFSSSKPSSF